MNKKNQLITAKPFAKWEKFSENEKKILTFSCFKTNKDGLRFKYDVRKINLKIVE